MFGVGAISSHVMGVARSMGCASDSLPFIHLGVPVDQNMMRVSDWSSIIDRFWSRLVGCKAKCLSFGGCITLIKFILGSLGS